MSHWFPLLFALGGIVLMVIGQIVQGKVGSSRRFWVFVVYLLTTISIVVAAAPFGQELLVPGLRWGYLIFGWAMVVFGAIVVLLLLYDLAFPDRITSESPATAIFALATVLTLGIGLVMGTVHIWVPFR